MKSVHFLLLTLSFENFLPQRERVISKKRMREEKDKILSEGKTKEIVTLVLEREEKNMRSGSPLRGSPLRGL